MPLNISGTTIDSNLSKIVRTKSIVSSNLVVHLETEHPSSYPGSGDYWYNIGTNGGSIYKGTYLPSYTTLGGVDV